MTGIPRRRRNPSGAGSSPEGRHPNRSLSASRGPSAESVALDDLFVDEDSLEDEDDLENAADDLRLDDGILLAGITKRFAASGDPDVGPLNVRFPSGQITVLLGPSGCGKTTTLRMINRLIEPSTGTITIDGVDIRDHRLTELRRTIGYVIQQVGLFPHRTIEQNIAVVPRLLGWHRKQISARIDQLAELVGIAPDLLDRYPSALSGGQQQRVGVARALAADPPVLLMDEPFGAVDPIVRTRLQHELLSLQARLAKTIVLVTHDLDEAMLLGDRVVLFNPDGEIEQVGRPDDLLASPASPYVEQFLGKDRTIRRLSLTTVGDLDLDHGPVVDVDSGRSAVMRLVEETGSDWIGVRAGDLFLGFIHVDELNSPKASIQPQAPAATVTPDATLREALDVILASRTSIAVVLDDVGDFVGTVTLDALKAGLDR